VTPYLHILVPEELWRVDGSVAPLPPPSADGITAVLHCVLHLARRDFESFHGCALSKECGSHPE
jgi:hypothetical protein